MPPKDPARFREQREGGTVWPEKGETKVMITSCVNEETSREHPKGPWQQERLKLAPSVNFLLVQRDDEAWRPGKTGRLPAQGSLSEDHRRRPCPACWEQGTGTGDHLAVGGHSPA